MFIPLSDSNKLEHINRQYVTLIIIAVNCLIWLILGTPAIVSKETMQATVYGYGFIPAVVNGYEYLPVELKAIPEDFTYLSYAFFHGDFMHLAGNMLFIWVFGDNVEDAMGHIRYLFFYLACAAAGALAHSFLAPQSSIPLIGASGAVAGIVGAYILLHPKVWVWVLALGRIPLKIPAILLLGAWIGFQFYQIITNPDSSVSFAAHIGGVIAGMILIVFMKRKEVGLFDRDLSKTNLQSDAPSKPKSASVPNTGKKKAHKWGRNEDNGNS